MHDRWDSLLSEHVSLESLLSDPAVLGDQSRLREVSRRYKELTPVVECIRRIESRSSDAEAARELIAMTDDAVEREQLKAEKDSAEADIARLEEELKTLLLPKDPNDGRPVIMEIRGAEGGEEANLFARDLYEMYVAYASRRGWKVETLSVDPSDLGGVNQATFVVRGDDAWSRLKFEGGPHRVQRVPVTESQGRIHTSSATVMVLPEAEEVDGGEKIRTYNFKENRLTDHRIGFTIYSLGDVLAGDLDGVIDALATDERSRQLAGDRD
ncbi:MAG: PCRF domain-containing protein [Acidimicrobiia bacterium]|nr:PCRF domain-containing protein [Acidimicrobiia bacterium]